MTPAIEKAIRPRTFTAEREAQLRGYTYHTKHNMWEVEKELDAERQISQLLASALQTARPECDDPTRRKIDDVLAKYEVTA